MENDLKFTMTAIIAAVKSGKEISIRISGTSMLPTFQNGDMVCIRSHPNYQVGDILVIIRIICSKMSIIFGKIIKRLFL